MCTENLASSFENHQTFDGTSKVFSGKLLLKYLMGFTEDYTKGILNAKPELALILAHSFANSYIGEVDAELTITKIERKVRHILPENRLKLKQLNRINKGGNYAEVKVACRMWDLYELTTLRNTGTDILAVKTSKRLERSRLTIIGFHNSGADDDRLEDVTQFITADISNSRVFLISEVFSYERWNLDINKKLNGAAYYAYENLQASYCNKDASRLMIDIGQHKNTLFLLLIALTNQKHWNFPPLTLKSSLKLVKNLSQQIPKSTL